MDTIIKEPTKNKPGIYFSSAQGVLEIKGRSVPENAIEFYSPLLESIKKYCEDPLKETIVRIKLIYFNTSSSKCLISILKTLEQVKLSGPSVKVLWFYEPGDVDMFESGMDFQSLLNIPMEMIEEQIE